MGYLKYVRDAWKKPGDNLGKIQQDRLILWRKEPATVRVKKPTRIDRARSMGYRAKQGIIVVRQRVKRGGRSRPQIRKGRRQAHYRHVKIVAKNYQQVCEERASKKYTNCEVLNSYFVGMDGKSIWYEVILIDRTHPQILKDSQLDWISTKKGRAQRGITSAGRKSRGLNNKGQGSEKIRPSLRAKGRRH